MWKLASISLYLLSVCTFILAFHNMISHSNNGKLVKTTEFALENRLFAKNFFVVILIIYTIVPSIQFLVVFCGKFLESKNSYTDSKYNGLFVDGAKRIPLQPWDCMKMQSIKITCTNSNKKIQRLCSLLETNIFFCYLIAVISFSKPFDTQLFVFGHAFIFETNIYLFFVGFTFDMKRRHSVHFFGKIQHIK